MKKKVFSIPADINNLSKVRDFIQKVAYQNYFQNNVIHAVKLAAEEVCTNIIRHGYQNKKTGSFVKIKMVSVSGNTFRAKEV